MQRIDNITLRGVIPAVFSASRGEPPVSRSQVWLANAPVEFTRPGEWLVAAESGTGKSSLCSFIIGDRTDYEGTISFNGRDIATFSMAEWCEIRCRHIAYLPQDMKLFPELTVMENILIKNRLTDICSGREIMDLLAELEVDGKADSRAGLLSIGQQQRVALVRAMCQPFDFIVLDEPVSHLDERRNAALAALVRRVAGQREGAVIATSVGNHLQLPFASILNL